jgi:hypothetical protein
MTRYKNVGEHAESLAGGQTLEPGDVVELDDEQAKDPYNAGLITAGTLIEAADEEQADETESDDATDEESEEESEEEEGDSE